MAPVVAGDNPGVEIVVLNGVGPGANYRHVSLENVDELR
jgi:hypothetical protein